MNFRYWKWTLDDDFTVELVAFPEVADFESDWITIKDSVLTIKAQYSWDGCSPKRKIFGVVFGTWDGPIDPETGKQQCYYGSLIHDALCQFKIPHRKNADREFYERLKKDNFKYARAYYSAVRIVSSLFFRY